MSTAKVSSPEEDSGGEDNAKSGSKRACDYCHRMKMRCINKENPPCNRCKQGGHDCTFGGPRKSKATRVEDRLKLVESQMSTFQSSLTELLQLQRASAQPNARTSSATPSVPRHSPPASFGSGPGMFNLATIEGQHRQPDDRHQYVGTPANLYMQAAASSSRPGYFPSFESSMSEPPRHLAPPSRSPRPKRSHAESTGFNSPATSDEDDPDPAIASASFPGPWRSMLSLAEAARLKADNQLSKDDAAALDGQSDPPYSARSDARVHPFDYGSTSEKKRRRSTLEDNTGLRGALPVQRGSQKHAHKDPVELGLISESRGRGLFESFMQNCQFYIPVFDPEQDTWDSMRQRSPFVIAATLYIGLKCEEAGGAVSELQEKLREHAEKIGMSTLFTPVARIEVVQALIIMAQWGDTIYRPGGHALRIATEMGLWRCLPYLVQTGMGAGKTPAELLEERPLVVGARVWLTLYKTECQMAFNSGRPIGISLESVKEARRFLDHPLTIATDSRLVPFCELQTIRLPLHTPYTLWPSTSNMPDLDQRLRDVNKEFAVWFNFWDSYYERKGYAPDALLRVTLTTMLCGTNIYCNSLILNGVRSKRDVSLLSEERQGFLLKAVKAAETLMNTAFRGEKGKQYLDRFRYANLNTHVNFAFVARFLIRMSSLVPEVVNVRQVGRDVEHCATMLSNVPGFQFAQLLRDILLKARKKHVLPPSSRAPSPTRTHAGFMPFAPTPSHVAPTTTSPATLQMMSGFSPNQGSESAHSNGLGLPELDFGLAEQLFSEGQGDWSGSGGGGFGYNAEGGLSQFSGPMEQSLGFDPWYPFPPLDTDLSAINESFNTSGQSASQAQFPASSIVAPSPLRNGQASGFGNGGRQDPSGGANSAAPPAPTGWW